MKKGKRVVFIGGLGLGVALAAYLVITGFGRPALSGLEVDSNTVTTVFVDGKEVGQTPYNGTFPSKEVTVSLGNYETRVSLQPKIKTIIQRDFVEGQSASSGEIISFEKTGEPGATIALISNPDGAKVSLDGSSKGFTPVNIDASAGSHQLHIEASGYANKDFSVSPVDGYKLIVIVDLAPSASKQTQTQNKTIQNQILVQILNTPTGFLRVRDEPSVASDEVGQVHPGETYPFIKTDDKTGWYDIQLSATASGWVANTYAATISGVVKN